MHKIKAIAMGLAVSGMIFAATAQAGITRSADVAMSAGRASACNVQVSRSEAPGVFSIERETLQDGSCVCNARTGPANQGGSAEAALAALLQSRECSAGLASARDSKVTSAHHGGALGTTALIVAAVAGGGLAAGLTRPGTSTGR